jgi:hypothetical protein
MPDVRGSASKRKAQASQAGCHSWVSLKPLKYLLDRAVNQTRETTQFP